MNIKLLTASCCVLFLAACSSTDPRLHQKKYNYSLETCNGASPTEEIINCDANCAFRSEHVMSYQVKKGDTLWNVASRFLKSPWRWKEVWYNNPHIKNPHLIYPGDVLSVVQINGKKRVTISASNNNYHGQNIGRKTPDGRPIIKYSPHVRVEEKGEPIVFFSRSIINPFLLKNELLKVEDIATLPFVFGDAGEYMTLTMQREIYAVDTNQIEIGKRYGVYRVGKRVRDPVNQREYGYQMDYVAEVVAMEREKENNLIRLRPVQVANPIREEDILLPIEEEPYETNYFPRIPDENCSGYMITSFTPTMVTKEYDTVVTSFGRDNNAQVGDVWKIVRQGDVRKIRGQEVKIPDKDVGFLMIYRVFDDVSYGFVLDSTETIYPTDRLVRP